MRDVEVFHDLLRNYDPRFSYVEFHVKTVACVYGSSGTIDWSGRTAVHAVILGSVVMKFTVDNPTHVTQAIRTAMDVLLLAHGNVVNSDWTSPPAQWGQPCS